MFRIGIISVSPEEAHNVYNTFIELHPEYESAVSIFIYQKYSDIKLFLSQEKTIDGWLFTGPNPHEYAIREGFSANIFAYCHITGGELYYYILKTILSSHNLEMRFGVDTGSYLPVVEDALSHLQLQPNQVTFMKINAFQESPQQIADKYRQLFQDGKIDMAFTSLQKVAKILRDAGYPAKHYSPYPYEVKSAIKRLLDKLEKQKLQDKGIAIELIEVSNYSELVCTAQEHGQLNTVETNIKLLIQDYCTQTNSYLAEVGHGSYELFSSYGSLKNALPRLYRLLKTLQEKTGLPFYSGIAYAENITAARLSAHKALAHARKTHFHNVVLANLEGTLIESPHSEKTLKLPPATLAKIQIMLADTSLSTDIYQRILFIAQSSKPAALSAAQLAQKLNVSTRFAQRILSELVSAGLAEITGCESIGRGRPTKQYTIRQL